MLQSRMTGMRFVACDTVLARAKAVKSAWELNKLRICGERHRKALDDVLPLRIHSGMSELDVAHIYTEVAFACGDSGLIRMNAHGEENFFGYVSVGASSIYPTAYNGPLGSRGLHPAVPFMGDAGTIWKPGMLLATDLGFSVEGYITDKTQTYWSGSAASIPDAVQSAHEVCVNIYQRAVAALKPGAIPATIWQDAAAFAAQSGYKDTFMGFGSDRVPFLGHGVGLAMDEYPVFAAGFNEPLEEGMVVAIEPKISLPGLAMVGLEHTLEITANGAHSLTGETLHIIPVE
ncbi:MAG: M24 family metallopeptidase [Bilophila sp.]